MGNPWAARNSGLELTTLAEEKVTALKGIIGEIIPEGYEPYSEFRPDEEVSSLIPPSSILKRQVPSILITVLGNKIIVELKRKLEEIYNS